MLPEQFNLLTYVWVRAGSVWKQGMVIMIHYDVGNILPSYDLQFPDGSTGKFHHRSCHLKKPVVY